MGSQTSLVTKQCRIQSWAMQIKDCQNRPCDMTVDEWCLQNNITRANYYYRLKCVRQACLDSMESTPEQYRMLMKSFAVVAKHPIEEMETPPKAM